MHCKACDVLLDAHELNRKGTFTGEFIDLCDVCLDTIRDDIDIYVPEEDELYDDSVISSD